jgi:hypothetical protein
MSGNLAMGGNDITGVNSVSDLIAPAAGSHATNKTYVDAGDADQVNKTGDSMTGALAMGDNKITGLATPTSTADATNKSYVDAQIATTLATGVAGGPIGTTNIADDAVTADKLAHTAVTPGFYTNTNITVDQQGRITAAATGSSGAPTANEILTSLKTVDGTGTGLDADLLDGLEATAFATTVSLGTAAYVSLGTFAPASHTHTAANITDFDTAVTTVVQSDASGATSAEYTPTVISRNNIDSDPTILQWGYTRVGRIIYLNIYVAWNGTGNLGLISSDVDASVKFSVPFLPESRFGSGNYGIIWKTELESILKTSDDVLSTSHFNKTSATVQNVSGTGQVTVNFFNSDTRYAWLVRGTIAYKLDNTVT